MLRPKNIARFLLATSSLVTAALCSSPAARAQTIDYASGEIRSNPIDLDGGDVTLNVAPGPFATQSGAITGANGINKTGFGSLLLSGANNYAGDTRVSDGMLLLAAPGALGSGKLILTGGDIAFLTGGSLTIGGMNQGDGIISRFSVVDGETLRLKVEYDGALGSFGAGHSALLYLGGGAGTAGTIEIELGSIRRRRLQYAHPGRHRAFGAHQRIRSLQQPRHAGDQFDRSLRPQRQQ